VVRGGKKSNNKNYIKKGHNSEFLININKTVHFLTNKKKTQLQNFKILCIVVCPKYHILISVKKTNKKKTENRGDIFYKKLFAHVPFLILSAQIQKLSSSFGFSNTISSYLQRNLKVRNTEKGE